METKRQRPPVSVGLLSVLCVFVVLVLAGFAALSVATASADYALTEKTAGAIRAYYQADSAAEEKYLALCAIARETEGDELITRLESAGFFVTPEESRLLVQYEVPMNEHKKLAVTIGIDINSRGVTRIGWHAQTER